MLDQFFTNEELVDFVLSHFNLNDYDLIIEPGAGSGAFVKKIKHPHLLYLDIEPNFPGTIKQDYLTWDTKNLREKYHHILTIGNPPFGKNNSLALKFLKKATEYSDTIAFVMPKSFQKLSRIRSIDKHFKILKNCDFHNEYFETPNGEKIKVPVTILIIQRLPEGLLREDPVSPKTSKHFEFVSSKDDYDFSIVRVGGKAGAIVDHVNETNSKYNYFIKCHGDVNEVRDSFNKNFQKLNEVASRTSGPRSLSKEEIFDILESQS